MKKLALLLLALVMVLAMVACGNTDETTLPVDDATDPVVTEPAETEPVETEPAETEPVVTEPVVTEPVVTEPVVTEPVVTEPVETEPVETEPAGNVIMTQADYASVGAAPRFELPAEVLGENTKPYQVDFTVTFNAMCEKGVAELYNDGKGRNLANYSTPKNPQILRQMPISDGNGGYLEDKIALTVRGDSIGHIADITTLGLGESIKITLVAKPAEGAVDVYANGEYIATASQAGYFEQTKLRFGDSTATCDITISGISISWVAE